ncbi:POK11 protein, partial [Sclerurus mexicanus]|nr:POK11 protein [Sclerurus mexicanus]
LTWLTDEPVWVDQWPLRGDRLLALNALIDEQLQKGRIVPSTSPWNSPIFVVKKNGKWRLVHDLRKINAVIEPMGAVQPGMPSPTMVPQGFDIVVIDIKECFFQIPISKKDSPRFAFTVPSVNQQEPAKRFQWTVLPQGMRNSPMICQNVVAKVLLAVRRSFPEALVYHYMDDILVAAESNDTLDLLVQNTIAALTKFGFELSPEKIQKTSPWKYLGCRVSQKIITPEHISINKKINTLHDLQVLLGKINWIRPTLKITTDQLSPLFTLLKGDSSLTSPRRLTDEAKSALRLVEAATRRAFTNRRWKDIPPSLFVLKGEHQPFAVIGQFNEITKMVNLWEWVFLSHQFPKTIVTLPEMLAQLRGKARNRIWELTAMDPKIIYLPITQSVLAHLLQFNINFQAALADYTRIVSIHYPKTPVLQFFGEVQIYPEPLYSSVPLEDAMTVFTVGSGNTGKLWSAGRWEHDIHQVQGSPQVAELSAVLRAFQLFKQSLNIVSDSKYVVGVVQRLENAYLKEINHPVLAHLFRSLLMVIHARDNKFFICHIRSHTHLPG